MTKPNIVFILADDMGYGDVSGLNSAAAFKTPHLDQMIDEGLHFTDAHTSSAVCTPSRYSILTGRYCWRTYLKKGVLNGVEDALIEKDRSTLASLAHRGGYDTACIGKWHLGWEWAVKDGVEEPVDRKTWGGNSIGWIDYSKKIKKGPTSLGFDYFYGISGSLDMPPYVYVENDLCVEEPTAWGSNHEFVREGPRMESIRANNVLGHITDKAVDYIKEHDSEKPFFLYFPITAPHTPISPAPEFDGKSGINPYADFCMEVDHRVGQIVAALKASGQMENTLLVFTTDNGASHAPSECEMLERHYGHYSSHVYRGYKSDIWDGGHRIPYIMQWPAGIDAGISCHQKVGIFDFYATFSELIGHEVAESEAEDSASFLPAFKGETIHEEKRWALIHHSIDGAFAIRKGPWKLCRCPGSGGWAHPNDQEAIEQNLPSVQLYHMDLDPGEQDNVYRDHPDLVEDLTRELHRCVVSGRSTPGSHQSNCEEVVLEHWEQINWLPEIPEAYVLDD